MKRKVLVDSNIWIDWGRGHFKDSLFMGDTVLFLLAAPVLAELEFGLANSISDDQLRTAQNLITEAKKVSEFVSFDWREAEEFGYLRAITTKAGKPRGPLDLMIASIARVHKAEVLTRDDRAGFAELLALPPRPID